ncbi:hypothetical protein J3F83DRAFT_764454 [Trichoderma novae-zelandiae]
MTGKRRCDKLRPFGRRCEDRGLDCRYAAPIRRTAAHHAFRMNLSNNQACHVYFFNTHISSLSSTSRPWFLAPETWAIEKSIPNSQCPFNHRQLYADGVFPSSMQDAFSSISIHQSWNSRTQDVVARIIQDRADSLFQNARIEQNSHMPAVPLLNTLTAPSPCSGIAQLPNPWQQTRAEEAMPTLLSCCQQMWDSATLDCITTSQTPDIPSESIRQTCLAVMITISVYGTTKYRVYECAGGIMFTARPSLWLASSPSQWETICRTEDPFRDHVGLPSRSFF